MTNKSITLISFNRHKFSEYLHLFKSLPLKLHPLDASFKGLLHESGKTFTANAIEKVNSVNLVSTWSFAEDSGLEVDALNGAPGIYSRRYSGTDDDALNNQKLLKAMAQEKNRTARFKAVIALKDDAGQVITFEGVCHGHIHTVSEGTSGHGYDPVFIPAGYAKTFAEMTLLEKSNISHRHMAARKLVAHLREVVR